MEAAPNSVGGKTARACDSCVRRRARWYCVADDAFLCQSCDSTVHSANPLALRHQRIRLKTASSPRETTDDDNSLAPSWLRGCKRKARTPRPNSKFSSVKVLSVVPDEHVETSSSNDGQPEDRLMYCVPEFESVLCDVKLPLGEASVYPQTSSDVDDVKLAGFIPSEMELDEFAANMESLLSEGLDGREDAFCIEKLGLVEPIDFEISEKVDEKGQWEGDEIELGFGWGSREEEDEELLGDVVAEEEGGKKKAKLSLDYEAVIAASSSQGLLPWSDGQRPNIGLGDTCWPDYQGMWVGGVQGEKVGVVGDGEREARVSRYREKRRMRLFSKKIRYEVRKLNAEKRPRMKGRFVKGTPGLALAH